MNGEQWLGVAIVLLAGSFIWHLWALHRGDRK